MSRLIILWQIKHVAVRQIQEIQIMRVTVQCKVIVYAVMIANVILMYVKKRYLNYHTFFPFYKKQYQANFLNK